MVACAGTASQPCSSNSAFLPRGELPAGLPAATTLRRGLTKFFFPLLQAASGFVRSRACFRPAMFDQLQPFDFFPGGRHANDFGSENTTAGDRYTRAECQAGAGAGPKLHVAALLSRLSTGGQARARRDRRRRGW